MAVPALVIAPMMTTIADFWENLGLCRAAQRSEARSYPGLTRITPAGDFRRGCELVSGLSLVAEVPKLDEGKTIRASEQLTVHLVEKSRYGITLLLATAISSRPRMTALPSIP